jgi:hypothetical protein
MSLTAQMNFLMDNLPNVPRKRSLIRWYILASVGVACLD